MAQLESTLPKLGFEFIAEDVPFPELLEDYYRQNGERKYDMNFMATNFLSVFDPYSTFGDDAPEAGISNPSGLYDRTLSELALQMHRAKAMDYLSYEKSWLAFQKRYNKLLPTLPLYSNVYFDFHTDRLQNYQPSNYASWPAGHPVCLHRRTDGGGGNARRSKPDGQRGRGCDHRLTAVAAFMIIRRQRDAKRFSGKGMRRHGNSLRAVRRSVDRIQRAIEHLARRQASEPAASH